MSRMNALPDCAGNESYKWLADTRAELYHRMEALEQVQRDVDTRLDKLEKSVEQSLASVHNCIDDLLTNLNKDYKDEENDSNGFEVVIIKKEQATSSEVDTKVSPVVLAAQAGDVAAVKDLLLTGALANDQSEEGENILEIASAAGYSEIVKLVLQHMNSVADGEVSSSETTNQLQRALLVAGNSSVAKLLIEKVGPYAATVAVRQAALEGRVTVLREILNLDVGVNDVDENGWSALHFAARCGHEDCIEVLLQFGAKNGYVGGPKLQTPLHLAAERGYAKCLDLMLRSGSHSINLRDRHGCTALFYAVSGTFVECVKVLLSHGAKVSVPNTKAKTPIHKAACLTAAERNNTENLRTALARRKEILKMLLEAGAKPQLKCENGGTAFDQDGSDALCEVMS